MGDEERRSSPPPPPPAATTQTGSYPAVIPRVETEAQRALRIALATREELRSEVGKPPIEATGFAGTGLWKVIAEVRTACNLILVRLDTQDKASAKWTTRAARVGWQVAGTVITLAVGAFVLWLSGHWHW